MTGVREHLEKAFAEAMYDELYVTAGLIAAALETIGVKVEAEGEGASQENIVVFPYGNNS